jgi:hypothetical protein
MKETGDYALSKRYAEVRFAEASNRAQQSASPQDLSYYQTLGVIGKILTAYATSPIQYQRNVNNAMRAFKNGRISGAQFAKTAVIFHVLLPQVFTAMGSAIGALLFEEERDWEKIKKRQKQAAILGNLNIIPLFGMIPANFANRYSEMNYPDPSVVVFDTMNQMGKGLANLLRGIEEGDEDKVEDGIKDVMESGGSMIGAPTSAIERTYKIVNQDD